MPKPNYSLAAHLLHSGLQMIWKRLKITTNMDHIDLMKENIELFNQVAKAMEVKYGVKSDRPDYGQASYMLIETFLQSEPLYHWVIVHRDVNNKRVDVTSDDGGNTFLKANPKTRMSEEIAYEMLLAIHEKHPHGMFSLQKRYYKDLPEG